MGALSASDPREEEMTAAQTDGFQRGHDEPAPMLVEDVGARRISCHTVARRDELVGRFVFKESG